MRVRVRNVFSKNNGLDPLVYIVGQIAVFQLTIYRYIHLTHTHTHRHTQAHTSTHAHAGTHTGTVDLVSCFGF